MDPAHGKPTGVNNAASTTSMSRTASFSARFFGFLPNMGTDRNKVDAATQGLELVDTRVPAIDHDDFMMSGALPHGSIPVSDRGRRSEDSDDFVTFGHPARNTHRDIMGSQEGMHGHHGQKEVEPQDAILSQEKFSWHRVEGKSNMFKTEILENTDAGEALASLPIQSQSNPKGDYRLKACSRTNLAKTVYNHVAPEEYGHLELDGRFIVYSPNDEFIVTYHKQTLTDPAKFEVVITLL
jgi:hypothetical protein